MYRTLRKLLLVCVILLGFRVLVSYTFGIALQRVFARGTQCEVKFEHPWVSFFPLSGSIRNVEIRHASEIPASRSPIGYRADPAIGSLGRGGFRAGAITVTVDFWRLFSREVALSKLKLLDVDAVSRGAETGFINTLDFVLGDTQQPSSSRSWRLFVTDLSVAPKKDGPTLLLGVGRNSYQWEQLSLEAVIPEPVEDPARLTFRAPQFTAHLGLVGEKAADAEAEDKASGRLLAGEFRAEATVGQGIVKVSSATLGAPEAVVVEGVVDLNGSGSAQLSVGAAASSEYLQELYPAQRGLLKQLQPRLQLSGDVSGPIANCQFKGEYSLEFAGTPGESECFFKQITGEVGLTGEQLAFRNIDGEGVLGVKELIVDFDKPLSYRFSAGSRISESSPVVRRCLGSLQRRKGTLASGFKFSPEGGQLALQLHGAGSLAPLKVSAELSASNLGGAEVAKGRPQLTGRVDLQERRLTVQLNEDGGRLKVDGDYSFATELAEIRQLELHEYPLRQMLSRVVGVFPPLLNWPPLRVLSEGVSGDTTLDIRLAGTGAAANSTASAALLSENTSSERLAVVAVGEGKFALRRFEFPVFGAGDLTGEFSAKEGQFRLSPLKLDGAPGVIAGGVELARDKKLRGEFVGKQLALERVASLEGRLGDGGTTGEVIAMLSGTVDSPAYDLRLIANTVAWGGRSTVSVVGSATQVEGKADLFAGRLTGSVLFPLVNGKELKLDVVAKELPVSFLVASSEQIPSVAATKNRQTADTNEVSVRRPEVGDSLGSTDGAISAHLTYSGLRESPLLGAGEVVVEKLNYYRAGQLLTHARPLVAQIAGGKLTFDDVEFASEGQQLRLTGAVAHDSGWNAKLSGNWDLGMVVTGLPGVEQVSGVAELAVAVSGPLWQPDLSGEVNIEGGSLSLPLGQNVVGASGGVLHARLSGQNIVLDGFRAEVGEGVVIGSGSVRNLFSSSQRVAELDLKLDDITLEPIERVSFKLAGAGKVTTDPFSPAKVVGEVVVTDGIYEDSVDLFDVIKQVTGFVVGVDRKEFRPSGVRPAVGTGAVEFDVGFKTATPFLVATDVVQAEVEGDLRVRGSSARPDLDGEISVVNGSFGIGANQFNIIQGKLNFAKQNAGIDPLLQIVGESQLRGRLGESEQVRILVGGQLSKPEVAFKSDRGLSQNEVVALIGVGGGRDARSVFGRELSKEAGIQDAANPFSRIGVGERVRALTGFSEIRVEPSFSDVTGEFQPKVVATRPLPGKLTLNVGSELSRHETSTATVEYPLTPHVSVVSGWRSRSITDPENTAGSLGAGVFYRRSFTGQGLLPPLFSGGSATKLESTNSVPRQ